MFEESLYFFTVFFCCFNMALERKLTVKTFKWFLSQRDKSIPTDGTFIKEKAMKYAKELGTTDFKALDGRLGRWKKM